MYLQAKRRGLEDDMRVLIVAPTFFPEKDVGIFRMTTLADYLISKEVDVTVIRKSTEGIQETDRIPYQYLKKAEEIKVKDTGTFIQGCRNYKREILEYCNSHHVDIIVYTCAPYYAMKIAPEIKNKNNIPYVIDIRDFWLKNDEESKVTVIKQNIIYPLKWYLQNRAFKQASNIIVVSENMKKKYEKYFYQHKAKLRIIYNGYDDQRVCKQNYNLEQSFLSDMNDDSIIKIGFSGVFCQYSKKFAEYLLQGINELNQKGYKIKLFHMGKFEKDVNEIILNKKYNPEIYQHLGYIPNEICIDLLKKMDANAIINFRKRGLGTKIFDYLYCGKPVLYVGIQETELADFLKESGCKSLCADVEQIKNSIIQFKNETVLSNCIGVGRYKRSVQNREYYKILQEVLGE
ncbi:glycosyltransferase [Clostridium sp. M62/1]|uniref:glycosyltransferase n=1 Tax=Clostridium sp. M62/1 TaxID=411486 RepID=UPI0035674A85